MSYRCHLCGVSTPPGQRRRVIRRMKADGNIAAEIPVCSSCESGPIRHSGHVSPTPAPVFVEPEPVEVILAPAPAAAVSFGKASGQRGKIIPRDVPPPVESKPKRRKPNPNHDLKLTDAPKTRSTRKHRS